MASFSQLVSCNSHSHHHGDCCEKVLAADEVGDVPTRLWVGLHHVGTPRLHVGVVVWVLMDVDVVVIVVVV